MRRFRQLMRSILEKGGSLITSSEGLTTQESESETDLVLLALIMATTLHGACCERVFLDASATAEVQVAPTSTCRTGRLDHNDQDTGDRGDYGGNFKGPRKSVHIFLRKSW